MLSIVPHTIIIRTFKKFVQHTKFMICANLWLTHWPNYPQPTSQSRGCVLMLSILEYFGTGLAGDKPAALIMQTLS